MSRKSASNSSAVSRLRQDYMRLRRDPVPYIVAEPLPSNILEWHYVITGPESSPYSGGVYHGRLVFPAEFPFKPPAIYMITPNGRFKTEMRLCLSISDYHPDTWNPAWSVSTILIGLISFMLEKSPTLGSVESSDYDKRQFAVKSHEFNLRNKTFRELFPETVAASVAILEKRKKPLAARLAAATSNSDDPLAASRAQLEQNERRGRGGGPGGAGGGGAYTAFVNFLVIGGFAAFAFVVQYVLQTIASTGE